VEDPLVGTTIKGRFDVLDTIGEGAMGSVYVASDRRGGKVALKLLKEQDDKMRAPERFLREVKLLSQLVHPNVVQFVEGGFDPAIGTVFYAMEFLSGDPLSALTSIGRASPALALTVARQTAEGIHAAHDLGFVHRDLKPGNLMLVPRDDGSVQVKILDFGLAFVHNERRLTDMGSAPGTVSYMSPEQLQGKVPDRRADLYGLGVVMFELVTGSPPFPGDTQVEIARDVLTRPAAKLDDLLPDLPAGFSELVDRLLAKDRDERPASAEAIVDEIATIQRGSSLRPPTVSHLGPSDDPRTAWRLSARISLESIKGA
jgi:serine/threonine protein kinase